MLRQPREASRADILQAARLVAELPQRFSAQSALIDSAIARHWPPSTGRPAEALRTLPLVSRKGEWTVLIDAQSAQPVGFVSLDLF